MKERGKFKKKNEPSLTLTRQTVLEISGFSARWKLPFSRFSA